MVISEELLVKDGTEGTLDFCMGQSDFTKAVYVIKPLTFPSSLSPHFIRNNPIQRATRNLETTLTCDLRESLAVLVRSLCSDLLGHSYAVLALETGVG
jgi:hypothetical protein